MNRIIINRLQEDKYKIKCPECKEWREIGRSMYYYIKSGESTGICRECMGERRGNGIFRKKVLYRSKKSIEQRRKYAANRINNNRIKLRRIKLAKGCQICGYKKCGTALIFHHPYNNKEYKQSSGGMTCMHSWKKIMAEVRKCIIVCANCHAEIHEKKRKGYSYRKT